MEKAALLALFLMEKTGSIFGQWTGRLPAAEQRALFGRFFGKGKITINGADETIQHSIKVCFGLDSEVTAQLRWGAL